MRRPLDFLRRLRRAGGPLLPKKPRCQAFRGLLIAILAVVSASALAGAVDPAGLATSRTDLTPKDQARVLAVTRPTTDFSKPEAFETMQGGAGTSRAQVD